MATIITPDAVPRLHAVVRGYATLLSRTTDEAVILAEGRELLRALVRDDDWLPPAYAVPDPSRYCQYPLYVDPEGRFSIVSFVWGPGQRTPIHDHTVWGLIGMLRGAERSQRYVLDADGKPRPEGEQECLRPGDVEAVSPRVGDIHEVANAYDDRVSISIHVYGADIGAVRRSVFTPDGIRKPFVSGYTQPQASLSGASS
ncbi:MAG: hypothetical protein QM661_01205 [Solimonas sp.]